MDARARRISLACCTRTDREAMHLSAGKHVLERAAGVLLGLACGDALGVPYASGPQGEPVEQPTMKGGGPGNWGPGEWSQTTAMAVAVAEGLLEATTLEDRVEAIARRLLAWHASSPPGSGGHTRAILDDAHGCLEAGEASAAHAMRAGASAYASVHHRAAGNSALARTAPIALAYLKDRAGCAAAARAVAELTHADPLVGDSCVLWSEGIRLAVDGYGLDLHAGLDLVPATRRAQWETWLSSALRAEPERFHPNGFTVTALLAAYAVVKRSGGSRVAGGLARAIRVGDDTVAVAATAGGLLGGYWGEKHVPGAWLSVVHGWPGLRMGDLVELAVRLVGDIEPGDAPGEFDTDVDRIPPKVVPHPHDPGVLIGNTVPPQVTAIVDLRFPEMARRHFEDVEVIDCWGFGEREMLDQGPYLKHAAQEVQRLRAAGHVILIYFPAVQHWQFAVAMAYSTLLGESLRGAWHALAGIWPEVGAWHILYFSVRDLEGSQESL